MLPVLDLCGQCWQMCEGTGGGETPRHVARTPDYANHMVIRSQFAPGNFTGVILEMLCNFVIPIFSSKQNYRK